MKNPASILGYVILIVLLTAGAASSLAGSNTVTSDDIVDGQVYSADIRNSTVSSIDIANGTITGTDVRDNSIGTLDLTDGTVSGTDLAPNTVEGVDVAESTLSMPTVNWNPTAFPFADDVPCDEFGIPPTSKSATSAWGDGFQAPRFGKDLQGRVLLEGLIKLGTVFTSFGAPCNSASGHRPEVGTLPSGFRPNAEQIFTVLCDHAADHVGSMRLDVKPTGLMEVEFSAECPADTTEWVSLSGISFDPKP